MNNKTKADAKTSRPDLGHLYKKVIFKDKWPYSLSYYEKAVVVHIKRESKSLEVGKYDIAKNEWDCAYPYVLRPEVKSKVEQSLDLYHTEFAH